MMLRIDYMREGKEYRCWSDVDELSKEEVYTIQKFFALVSHHIGGFDSSWIKAIEILDD